MDPGTTSVVTLWQSCATEAAEVLATGEAGGTDQGSWAGGGACWWLEDAVGAFQTPGPPPQMEGAPGWAVGGAPQAAAAARALRSSARAAVANGRDGGSWVDETDGALRTRAGGGRKAGAWERSGGAMVEGARGREGGREEERWGRKMGCSWGRLARANKGE